MDKIRVDLIAGTRPNFVKIAALYAAFADNVNYQQRMSLRLIHTGQHYAVNMSESFFSQLGIPEPDYNFGIGSGTHALQTGSIMVEYEKLLSKEKTDLCVVVGDVNSTMACALAAKKMNIDVAHIEAGIRSGDKNMPEEINRIVTDSVSDYFFTTTQLASENLIITGIDEERIFFVGNTMIDTLLNNIKKFQQPKFFREAQIASKEYFVVTLHRPSNVDDHKNFLSILEEICKAAKNIPIIFPVHPRTKKQFLNNNKLPENLILVDPQPYLEFNWLVKHSLAVVTDSGGITEEATFMSVPCITLRNTTERPETVTIGTNVLVGENTSQINSYISQIVNGLWKKGQIPDLWDGKTGDRILKIISEINFA